MRAESHATLPSSKSIVACDSTRLYPPPHPLPSSTSPPPHPLQAAEGLLERSVHLIFERDFLMLVRALFEEFDRGEQQQHGASTEASPPLLSALFEE